MGNLRDFLSRAWLRTTNVIESEHAVLWERYHHRQLEATLLYNESTARCILILAERCTMEAIDHIADMDRQRVRELSVILGEWR